MATAGELLQFINCRLVRDHRLIQDDLWVRNGKIINPEPVFFDEQSKAHRRIDCGGAIIAPGYIDIQINGKNIWWAEGLNELTYLHKFSLSIN